MLCIEANIIVAQSEISVKVIDNSGVPIENVEVYYCDNVDCQNGLTDASGNVSFNMLFKPTAIIAYDTKGVFGMNSLRIEHSSSVYMIILPPRPFDDQQAGAQLDGIWNNIVSLYSTYRDMNELAEAYRTIQSGGLGGLSATTYGIPAVFSISPLPIVGPDGKLGFELSGELAYKLIQIFKLTRSKMIGGQDHYYAPSL